MPHRPEYGGLGPPTLPRYRGRHRALPELPTVDTEFAEISWREGSKAGLTSHFAALEIRPAGKLAARAAQEAGGGRNRWDGVLTTRTLLVEWPPETSAPTGYWISHLPVTTPIEDLVRWAKMRWRVEHDYRELKHGLGLDHFEGRSWRGRHHHVTKSSMPCRACCGAGPVPAPPAAGTSPEPEPDEALLSAAQPAVPGRLGVAGASSPENSRHHRSQGTSSSSRHPQVVIVRWIQLQGLSTSSTHPLFRRAPMV
ncbi:hypothetical protein [Streptomyces inhibens]|uniref:hypothetical protein n=1 Tax=Streptomyces inhibens TaxID=2293571 RepID=UPI003CCA447F